MENENIVDKIYLALELTKIKYNNVSDEKSDKIYNSFEYFVKRLTEIEDLSEIKKIKDENKTLKVLYEDMKVKYNEKEVVSIKHMIDCLDEIKTMINNNSGNMESFVRSALINYIDYEIVNLKK